MSTTGERIKAARIKAGMTQTELAEKVGVKYSAIHKYENGIVVNLKRDTIDGLASALNVKPSYLLCIDEEKPTTENGGELDEYLEMLRTRPECRMLFSLAKGATKEDVMKAVAIVEALRKQEGK